MYLTEEELYVIQGGAAYISASNLNSICRFIDTVLNYGRICGAAARKIFGR